MKNIVCVALCLMAICMVSGTPSEYKNYKTKNLNENIELEFSSPSSPRNKRTIGIFTSFLNAFTNTLQRSNPPPPPPPARPARPARPAPRNNNNANNNGNLIGYSVFAGVQPITGVLSINPLPNPTPAPSAPAGMEAAVAPPPPPTKPMAPPPPPLGPSRVNIPLTIVPAAPAPPPTTNPPPPPPPPTTMPPPPPPTTAAPPPTTGVPPTTTDLLPGGDDTTLGGDSAQSTTFGDEGDDDYIDSSTEVEDDNAISPKAAARTQSSSSSSEFDQLYNNNNYWINPSPPAWFRSGSIYSDSREEDTDSSNGVQTFGVKYSEPIRQQHNKHNRNYNAKPIGGNQFQQYQYSQPEQYQQFKSDNYQPFTTAGRTSGSPSGSPSGSTSGGPSSYPAGGPAGSPAGHPATIGGYEFNVPTYSTNAEYTMPASHSRVKMHDNGFDQFTYHDHRFGAQPAYRVEYHGKRDWA